LDEIHGLAAAPSRRGRSPTWRAVVLTAVLAVMLVGVGMVIGRASAAESGPAAPFDLDAFAAAWGSGDADQIRAFYTDDAVMMPFGHILASLSDHPMPEYWDVSGIDMDREAAEHSEGTFEIFTVEQIGNMLVGTGQWTFHQGSGLEDTVIKATDIMHLRENKIWRHFTDFEIYVAGDLIEM
jgi:ketosteroid isomerase-like protein